MTRLTVVVTADYLVPNSYRVIDHPVDGIECLLIRGRYYLPGIIWLERCVDPQDPPHGSWVQDDEMTESLGCRLESEGAEFTLEHAS